MYVLDSSIFASVVVKDEYYDVAVNFIKRHFKEENVTVELAFIEVANALWKHTYVLKRIPEDKYLILKGSIKSLISSVAKICGSIEILEEAVDNAIRFGVSVYDSLYLTLALNRGGKLITLDERLARMLGERGLGDIVGMP